MFVLKTIIEKSLLVVVLFLAISVVPGISDTFQNKFAEYAKLTSGIKTVKYQFDQRNACNSTGARTLRNIGVGDKISFDVTIGADGLDRQENDPIPTKPQSSGAFRIKCGEGPDKAIHFVARDKTTGRNVPAWVPSSETRENWKLRGVYTVAINSKELDNGVKSFVLHPSE